MESAASGDLTAPHAPVVDSCLNCHQPHAGEHPKLLTSSSVELCAMCHDATELQEVHSGQITSSVDCTSCHFPHGSENRTMLASATQHAPFADGTCDVCHREPFAGRIRLRSRGNTICEACHGDLSEGAGDHGSVHQALVGARSRAGCINCHDPHMSANSTLLNAAGSALCGTCHGPILEGAGADTGHAPAAEDCLNCHMPHVSTNPGLLMETTPDLCVICHDVEDADLAQAHLGADLAGLDCVACHSPHGTGHEHLMAENVHAAILDGCDTCHEGSYDALVADGESELCLACHDDIGEAAESAAVPHPAMEMARCADCHNPHASPQEKLVKLPAGGECTVCHEDQAAGAEEVAHGVITLLGCRACHEPHGGDGEKLLRVAGNALCLDCHSASRVRVTGGSETFKMLDRFEVDADIAKATASLKLSAGETMDHPIDGHRTLGRPDEEELARTDAEFEGEFSCLTCHDPHKGASKHLFKGGVRSSFELCGTCHLK
jgi:predicted CXXCH cytochrome family protein